MNKEMQKFQFYTHVSELEDLKQIQEDAALRLFENCVVQDKHPSCQHSMFILEEEVQELKDEFHKKDSSWDYGNIYDEALDIIASCYRLILDNNIINKAKQTNEDLANEVLS